MNNDFFKEKYRTSFEEALYDNQMQYNIDENKSRLYFSPICICKKCYSFDVGRIVLKRCPECCVPFEEIPFSVYQFLKKAKSDKFILEKLARFYKHNMFTGGFDYLLDISWSGLKSEKDISYTKDSWVYDI